MSRPFADPLPMVASTAAALQFYSPSAVRTRYPQMQTSRLVHLRSRSRTDLENVSGPTLQFPSDMPFYTFERVARYNTRASLTPRIIWDVRKVLASGRTISYLLAAPLFRNRALGAGHGAAALHVLRHLLFTPTGQHYLMHLPAPRMVTPAAPAAGGQPPAPPYLDTDWLYVASPVPVAPVFVPPAPSPAYNIDRLTAAVLHALDPAHHERTLEAFRRARIICTEELGLQDLPPLDPSPPLGTTNVDRAGVPDGLRRLVRAYAPAPAQPARKPPSAPSTREPAGEHGAGSFAHTPATLLPPPMTI